MSHLRAKKAPLQLTDTGSVKYNSRSTRRRFLQGIAATGSLFMFPAPGITSGAKPKIVIIGGGSGGAAFIRALRARAPAAFELIVVTDQKLYNPPFTLNSIPQKKAGPCATTAIDLVSAFERQKATVVVGRVERIDLFRKTLTLAGSDTAELSYDAVVAAPGVALNWDSFGLKGTPDKSAIWTSEANCQNFLSLLQNVPVGGTFSLVAPAGHSRCPPAIYERACRAARWFKAFNKTAKILIIDEKDEYPMQAMFEEAYVDYYEDMIEWIPRDFHGGVKSIDLSSGNIQTDSELFETDVVNAIPPQQAPDFLVAAGMTGDDGFCAIRTPSMQSALSSDVYVIGDASAAEEMSKSAVSAEVQARLAADDIITRYLPSASKDKIDLADTCWTLVAPEDAISLGGIYSATGTSFSSNERFMSTVDENAEMRKSNAELARKWPGEILQSLYGS